MLFSTVISGHELYPAVPAAVWHPYSTEAGNGRAKRYFYPAVASTRPKRSRGRQ